VVLTQPGVAVIIATHDPTITQIAHITYEISDGVIHQITQLEALPGG
jgi:ABC-type lipoprotein export system ATPase subunit